MQMSYKLVYLHGQQIELLQVLLEPLLQLLELN